MTKLERLYAEYGQSPWLDNLTRGYLRDGTLARMVADGIRGVTANPTIFARAIDGSADYDEQFSALTAAGCSVEDAYWELVVADITAALAVLRPVFDASGGTDGFVSVEVAPELAHDTQATIAAARALHERIDAAQPVREDPGDRRGRPRHRGDDRRGPQHQHHPDLLPRPLRRGHRGLPVRARDVHRAAAATRRRVHSVASFFVSRVDTEVDRRLETRRHRRGAGVARPGRGRPGQARLPAVPASSSPASGGNAWPSSGRTVQRPLWASTSTKNPAYPDTLYVDELIGPDTVNTLPEATIAAFEDHGTLARTIDTGVDEAAEVMRRLAAVGVDMDDVGLTLEDQGVAGFHKSFQQVLAALAAKARHLSRR